MIVGLLKTLSDWGVEEVCVNLHHRADRMLEQLVGVWPRPHGLRLHFSHEPFILGTGGALRRMAWFIDGEPFWLCNADVRMELSPLPLLQTFHARKPLAALWVVPDQGPRTVQVADEQVVDFRGGGVTFTGLHLVSPRLLEHIPQEECFFSIIEGYEKAMAHGERIAAIQVPDSHWADVGTPEQLLAENGGSLVLPGSTVEPGVVLDQAIVGVGAQLRKGRRARGVVSSPMRGLAPEEHAVLPGAEAVEFLPPRGSDRTFRRVHLRKRTVILMRSGEHRPENARFGSHTRFLSRHGIPVPEIFHESRKPRFWILQDLGRIDLLERLQTGTPSRNRHDLRDALQITAQLHALRGVRGRALEPAFSPTLYEWEHVLFLEKFLNVFDSGTDPAHITACFQHAAGILGAEPKVLVHRDLQSTNFMWTRKGLVLIDYQGMRMGPAAYDLASFLADPYVERPLDEQLEGLSFYNLHAMRPVSETTYRMAAVQRLAQALGAYGRLGALSGTERFLQHVPSALRQLRGLSPFPVLTTWAESFLLSHLDFPKPNHT